MNPTRATFFKWAAAGAVAAGALFAATSASAGVAWSVGINAPGIAVGVAAPPVYYAPAPTYYAPAPAYYAPPVYYRPAPVYYAPPVYYRPAPGYYRHYGPHRHWR
ncbi:MULTISPECIES: hypothetical protein [unclassified Variovorax]|uniref:hypothetical protein n=1 Tax=unclassified Variovorax TaxID=663243 RepID=UPI00131922DC|nr:MULTISPECIES: hypothetical protein [unclassified Variovorax]VTU23976.1 hypothetical protein SRS16CHR_03360 [Variovorax sp. SRS16]VTU32189.1 hypothetical protein E5CHR_03367 [Variovorax sp. PBL-E5]